MTGPYPAHDWRGDRLFWAFLILAAVLRFSFAQRLMVHHADEVWQYLEPAYRIAHGEWVQTWEWRQGARSWLLPTLLAVPMKLGLLLAPHGTLHLLLPRMFAAALSLAIPVSAMLLGFRFSRLHGLMAGFVAAIWWEFIYFAPRTLSESIAVALFLGAAWLLLGDPARTARRMAAAGLLLGLCALARFQYAPAALLLAAFGCGREWRRAWLPLAIGGAGALAMDGVANLLQGQAPLAWILTNVHANLVEGRAASFGVEPGYWYLQEMGGLAALPLLALALLGARRYPALMAAALLTLALHSAVGHKEYRFILLATTLFVLLAAWGTADLILYLRARIRDPLRFTVAIGAGAAWVALSAATAVLPPFQRHWKEHRAFLTALRAAQGVPGVCGIALYDGQHALSMTRSVLNRDVPVYLFHGDDAPQGLRRRGAFNVALSQHDRGGALGPAYRFVGCFPRDRRNPDLDQCLWVRPGGCSGEPPGAFDVDAVLARRYK